MSALEVFNDPEWGLRVTPDGDSFRVGAAGLARVLGYRDAADLIRTVPAVEKGYELVRTPGGEQRVAYLTEAGFFRALGQRQAARISDQEVRSQVERFQSWVYGVALPSLRRGDAPRREMTRLELIDLAREAEVGRLSAEIERDASRAALLAVTPMVEAFQDLMDADGFYSWGAAAQILKWGRNTLTKELRRLKVIQTDNRPYQRYARYFFVQATSHRDGHGDTHADFTTRVRPEGLDYLRRRLSTGMTEVG